MRLPDLPRRHDAIWVSCPAVEAGRTLEDRVQPPLSGLACAVAAGVSGLYGSVCVLRGAPGASAGRGGVMSSAQQEKANSSTSWSMSAVSVVPPPCPEACSGRRRYGPPLRPSAWSLATILSGSYGGAFRSFSAGTKVMTG